MKKILLLILLIFIVGCSKGSVVMDNKTYIIINDKKYELELDNNETTNKLIEMLPLKMNMIQLNNNELYYYLDNNLPTNTYNPKDIKKGDVMLFGNNCLVVFYDSFETTYSYTYIGHINNFDLLNDSNYVVEIINESIK